MTYETVQVKKLTGGCGAEVLGVDLNTLSNRQWNEVQAAFVEASYFGRAATAEVRLKRTDGSYVWTEMRCRPATPNGPIDRAVTTAARWSPRRTGRRTLRTCWLCPAAMLTA